MKALRQAMAYSALVPVLIDAVNELAERVEDLEAYRSRQKGTA